MGRLIEWSRTAAVRIHTTAMSRMNPNHYNVAELHAAAMMVTAANEVTEHHPWTTATSEMQGMTAISEMRGTSTSHETVAKDVYAGAVQIQCQRTNYPCGLRVLRNTLMIQSHCSADVEDVGE